MIQPISFAEEHIRELHEISGRDPVLLERAVYAFGLLEALARVGMPFIFKGGTCLMLLMERPRRLSTDIDIIVAPGTDLDTFIQDASKIFPFQSVEEQKRLGKNNIEKRHFKFTYDSPINHRPLYILLDVLFEENHYTELVDREIKTELLLTEPKYLTVQIPSADCILADKLTAFAPHTTGIPLNKGKDMEVVKQFYDVSSLLDVFSSLDHVKHTYEEIARAEAAYRGLEITAKDSLQDTFDAALCIAARGKYQPDEYNIYVKGIRELRGHIYTENYSSEVAAVQAPKVMYIAACLLAGAEHIRVDNYKGITEKSLHSEKLKPLRYLRKASPEAYAYAILTDELI